MAVEPVFKIVSSPPILHRDPVCGMNVSEAGAAGKLEHEGHVYYFCASSCLQKFKADPRKYLDPQPSITAKTAAHEGVDYTCPMHPEIVQKGPGACPICGMALEPRTFVADNEENPELRDMTRRFWICVALTAPLLALMIFAMGRFPWVEFILATPVVLWGGWPFFERGWRSVVSRHLNMFTLIGMGTAAAYLYSLAAVLVPQVFPAAFRDPHSGALAVYFEPASVIVTLVLLGQVLELRARSRTSSAIQALLGLTPKTARLIHANGHEEDIPLAEVKHGDRLRIRPGERVPVDGVVREGASWIDESMVTGESLPVEKGPGANVTGGTINGTGSLIMQAERVGNETVLAQIVRMVGEAQRSRAPIQRLADTVSGWFVPAVITVAALAAIGWAVFGPEPRGAHALLSAVAVLIIACPCALGLATPMAIMVGTGRGAQAGVLIRNAEALEILEKIDTLVIDKTGTLTEGKPKLVSITALNGHSETEILRLTGGLEQASEHPLAAAIVAKAKERGIALSAAANFQSSTGKGVRGTIDGHDVSIGNAAMFNTSGADAKEADALRKQGQTVIFVGIDGQPAGFLGVADPVKQSSPEAIQMLHAEGVRLVMLTGDHRATAEAVAHKLGIDEIEADVLPGQKAEAVKRLQSQGHRVAMAGDGVNDAPALAQADVGIAMGTGTDVAMESAGVTLVKGDLRALVRARRLSRATMRNIRQNLFLAFIYNALGVPIAAGILYPFLGITLSPMIASAAMTLSSISVIGNALRLRDARL